MIVEMEKYVQQTTLTITHQWDKKIMLGNFMILGCLEVGIAGVGKGFEVGVVVAYFTGGFGFLKF